MKTNTLIVTRKPLDEHVFVQTHSNVHLFQHTCEQHSAILCCPRFQPETTFASVTVIQKSVLKDTDPTRHFLEISPTQGSTHLNPNSAGLDSSGPAPRDNGERSATQTTASLRSKATWQEERPAPETRRRKRWVKKKQVRASNGNMEVWSWKCAGGGVGNKTYTKHTADTTTRQTSPQHNRHTHTVSQRQPDTDEQYTRMTVFSQWK